MRSLRKGNPLDVFFLFSPPLSYWNLADKCTPSDFDETGYYTLKKSAQDSHDPWLDSLTDSDIQKAKESQERQMAKQAAADAAMPQGKIDLLREVIALLDPEETTLKV
jgi:hypothetical protein